MLKIALWIVSLALAAPAWAQTEAFIKKAIEERLPGFKVEGIVKTPFMGGLYEVRNSDAEIIYTDEKVNHLFIGSVRDGKNVELDYTAERVKKLTAVRFDELPLANAFKMVRGKGTKQVVYFTDPNCPYCRQIEKELLQLDDVTIHVMLYPILNPQDSPLKARAVWCSADKAKAWNDLMLNGVQPQPAPANCAASAPIDKIVALGRKLKINSVPTLILANGERIAGMRPANVLKQMIDEAGPVKQGAAAADSKVAAKN
jgi:thiol:disulfide interchange protein DsbC